MTRETAEKSIKHLKNVYDLENKKLKQYKQLEISLKAELLGINLKNSKDFSQLPDHDKHFHRFNGNIIVGLVNTKTQEKFYFDEPVFNVNSISVFNPEPNLDRRYNYLSPEKQTVAEKYLLQKRKEEKEQRDREDEK